MPCRACTVADSSGRRQSLPLPLLPRSPLCPIIPLPPYALKTPGPTAFPVPRAHPFPLSSLLQTVLGYKGALGGSLVVVVFPAWMYFGLTQRRLAAAAPGAATGSVSGAAAVADWAVRKDDSSPADDKAALLLADSAAAVEGGVLAPAASGVPLAELRWEWRDLLHTRHGLLAAAGSVLGAALMVSGTLAASHVI